MNLMRLGRLGGPVWISGVALLVACSQGTAERSTDGKGDDTPGAASSVTTGIPEKSDTPVEIAVEGDDKGIVLHVDNLGKGDYEASIVSVDGSKVVSTVAWKSDTKDPKADEVTKKLALPKDIENQADLVRYNLRIVERDKPNMALFLRSLLYFFEPYEVQLQGPAKVTLEKEVSYRVVARDPVTQKGLAERKVSLHVTDENDAEVDSLEGTTDEFGVASLKLKLAKVGAYKVHAQATGAIKAAKVDATIQSEASGNKVLLTTDKPLYKPGQTIHLRALALSRGGNKPIKNETAVLEVSDAKGNKIFKRSLTTDEFGIASVPFKIGSVVNEGTFTVNVSVGDSTSQKTVQVSQYALPKFKLSAKTDRQWYLPGDTISGSVDAHYFFGKAVQGGTITVEAATLDVGRNVYQSVMGTTNDDGVFEFSVMAPNSLVGLPLEQGNAAINLTITALDTAGQQVTSDLLVPVAQSALQVSVVPEGGQTIAGMVNRLNVFVTDPVGAPVPDAKLTLSDGSPETLSATMNKQGYAVLEWTPAEGSPSLSGTVTHGDDTINGLTFTFSGQSGQDHVLVRTDKSLYDVGETVQVEVLTTDEQGSIFVDLLSDGQAVDQRTLAPKDGSASFSFPIDDALLGENRIEAYVVQEDGNVVRAGRTIFTRNASGLNVDIATDQDQYAPGAPAEITFSVTDQNGEPQAAALGVQIVDEAVFSLIDARPGLLNTFFELEDEFATPSYELQAPPGSFADVVFARPKKEADQQATQSKAQSMFAALGEHALMGVDQHSWPQVVNDGNTELVPAYDTARTRLVAAVNAVSKDSADAVVAKGCSLQEYWCNATGSAFVQEFSKEVQARLKFFDFWGNAYAISGQGYDGIVIATTTGPDEVVGTTDDHVLTVSVSDLDMSQFAVAVTPSPVPGVVTPTASAAAGPLPAFGGVGAADGNLPEDEAAGMPAPESGTPTSPGATPAADTGPRVRREFPETLYFNPAVITDGTGQAKIQLDLADSITQWRISSLANSTSGQLGSAVGAMTVFQDFFVDVNFPATLTRGDEVTFPIAVYNYLDEPQTVSVEIAQDPWFTALGETSLSVELQPGEVKGVSFPVRVETVGLKTLTVNATGSSGADAVARSVRVVPDGQLLASAQSGAIADSKSFDVNFDPAAVPGSEQLYVNIYPTFLSQAVSGLDSMLQVPSGCFEQTTSTAWPNVLVTRYMIETDQITPEIQLKAEELMSAGYQRLLTFEHPGGGFSWFGTEDPAPYLSVTAFGLMEFYDMAKVQEVDQAMLDRTVQYLLSQQQADGSWPGDMSEFFSFASSELRNTAFTLMAVGSSQYAGPEVGRAVDFVKAELAKQTDIDTYTLALVANAFAEVAPSDSATTDLIQQLIERGKPNADDDTLMAWDSEGTMTPFYASGPDADVTTTAMTVHALLLAGGYPEVVTKGLNTLAASKDTLGNFGSTQASVWALKALLLAATKGTDSAVGSFEVFVDGDSFRKVSLTAENADVMTTVDLSNLATSGAHSVDFTFDGEGKVSINLVSAYNLPWAEATQPEPGPLSVDVAYDRTSLAVDETVSETVTVTNNTDGVQNMPLVTVGLPPGFEVERDDLNQYLSGGGLSKFDVTGKQVIFYISELAANASLTLTYRLRATMPVKASDGGASVYPYYQPDQKREAPEQQIEVVMAE